MLGSCSTGMRSSAAGTGRADMIGMAVGFQRHCRIKACNAMVMKSMMTTLSRLFGSVPIKLIKSILPILDAMFGPENRIWCTRTTGTLLTSSKMAVPRCAVGVANGK